MKKCTFHRFFFEKFWWFRKKCYLCNRKSEMLLFASVSNAAIAQLVEHNLAKVGVAGSSPVCRSAHRNLHSEARVAQVAELVDAHVSGACVLRRAGSSPVLGTIKDTYYSERWRNW